MFESLDANTLTVAIAIAAGIGAVVAAVVTGLFSLRVAKTRRESDELTRKNEQAVADGRLAKDREHALAVMREQLSGQRQTEIHRLGRETANNMFDVLEEIEATWTKNPHWDVLDVDAGVVKKARLQAFRVPSPTVVEVLVEGLDIIQHAWVGARSEDPSVSSDMQRKELRRLQETLTNYISGREPESSVLVDQRAISARIDDLFQEYFAETFY